MKKAAILMILLVFLASSCSNANDDALKAKKIVEYHKKEFENLPLSGRLADGVREINLKALQFRWEPDTIVVKKGDKVRLIIDNIDAPHGFEIEGVQLQNWDTNNLMEKGKQYAIEYTADEAGTWDLVCTGYCGPGHAGMRGKYIVKDKRN